MNEKYVKVLENMPDCQSLSDLSLFEINVFPLNSLLHSEDRNSMSFSVESRLPFLDHRLVEYVLGLPDDYKISKTGVRKYILRRAIKGLPDKIRKRRDKLGFVSPDERFLRYNKEEVVIKLISLRDRTDFIDEELITAFRDFAYNRGKYHVQFFRAFTLSVFLDLYHFTNV